MGAWARGVADWAAGGPDSADEGSEDGEVVLSLATDLARAAAEPVAAAAVPEGVSEAAAMAEAAKAAGALDPAPPKWQAFEDPGAEPPQKEPLRVEAIDIPIGDALKQLRDGVLL